MSDAVEVRHHGIPRGVLIGAAALVAFTMATTWFGRNADIGAVHMPDVQAYSVLQLRFVDGEDGRVVVRDAVDGADIITLAPGADAFIRATVRGLASERRREGFGEAPPFLLTRWSDGTLSIEDPTTKRRINLDAFGPTNAGAFARLFSARESAR